jgi:deoxyribodipyrimidine photolyase
MISARYLLFPVVAVVALPSPTSAAVTVDAPAEVATALYAAAATQAAFAKASDAKLRALRGQIEALRGRLAGAGSQTAVLRAQLIAAQQDFVTQLAEKDRAYAEAIAQFRDRRAEAIADGQ